MKILLYNVLFSLFTLISCSNATQPNDPIPAHETFKINSKKVNEERVINVWLPSTYKKETDSLDVLYMADGGVKEDFPHIANTLDKLIKEKKIKPLILVGIENTQRRRDLSGFTAVKSDKKIAPEVGGSANFRAFISDELFPEINKRYGTTMHKSIIGESLAGLFVIETCFLAPDMFDNYIAFDPSLWWNDQYLVKTAQTHISKFPENNKKIWFAGSDAKDISPYTNQLAKVFETENKSSITWHYADEPKEQHTTIFRATKEKALIWMLND